jgi:hypothetical protein
MKLPFPLQETEKVLVVCRRHWIFLWPNLVLQILIAILPVLALYLVLRWADALGGLTGKVALVVSIAWLLVWGVKATLVKYRYDNDLWTITDQRLVDSYRSSPLSLKITSADLVDIVDTAMNRSGLLATMLNYGDIRCETAGERQDISLAAVPRPQEVHALIDRERDRERKNKYRAVSGGESTPPS